MKCRKAWISKKSPAPGVVASGPHRIMSTKVADEVVCQCDFAHRAIPSAIIKSKLDNLVQKARDLGKDELISELKSKWTSYNANTTDGNAAAGLGASMTFARHELVPENACVPECAAIAP